MPSRNEGPRCASSESFPSAWWSWNIKLDRTLNESLFRKLEAQTRLLFIIGPAFSANRCRRGIATLKAISYWIQNVLMCRGYSHALVAALTRVR